MLIKQAELFWGLSHDFTKHVMEKAEKESHEHGQFLFYEGEPASYFFVLIKGRVKLKVGERGNVVFTVNHPGESFGWSSLVDRDVYSASAQCVEPTTVMKIRNKDITEMLSQYPSDGLVFMRRLAALLGQRLLQSYDLMVSSLQSGKHQSYGTGQVQEMMVEE